MFIQVIQGNVGDRERLSRQLDKWRQDLKPGATGYLGSTGGITPDGRAIYLARFESEDAARANSDRPEQGSWWAETAPAFSDDPVFYNCAEVDLIRGGGSNDAGFVQVIQGRATDQEQMRALGREFEGTLGERRPDVLGAIVAWHGDGGFTQAVYFRSEDEARQGEKNTEDDELRLRFMELIDGQPSFFDIPEPEFD